jgi:hypothetical protein
VELPTAILQDLFNPVLRDMVRAHNRATASDAVRALLPYLPAAAATGTALPRVIRDSALEHRIDAASGDRLPVRIYNLTDPRTVDIRKALGTSGEGGEWLLTLKP